MAFCMDPDPTFHFEDSDFCKHQKTELKSHDYFVKITLNMFSIVKQSFFRIVIVPGPAKTFLDVNYFPLKYVHI